MRILDFFQPLYCIVCQHRIDPQTPRQYICTSCWRLLFPISSDRCCQKCGVPLISENKFCVRCRDQDFSFTFSVSCFSYIGLFPEILHRYKREGSKYIAWFFADILHTSYKLHFLNLPLVAIPSSPQGYKSRGFHPILRIMSILRRKYGVKCYNILQRKKSTEQKLLSYEERLSNLKNKIVLKRNYNFLPPHIVLLDDLFTTGATLQTCSKVLAISGVKRCDVLTIAVV